MDLRLDRGRGTASLLEHGKDGYLRDSTPQSENARTILSQLLWSEMKDGLGHWTYQSDRWARKVLANLARGLRRTLGRKMMPTNCGPHVHEEGLRKPQHKTNKWHSS